MALRMPATAVQVVKVRNSVRACVRERAREGRHGSLRCQGEKQCMYVCVCVRACVRENERARAATAVCVVKAGNSINTSMKKRENVH